MKNETKQFEVLKWASLFLEKHHCEQVVAEILLLHHLNVSRSAFYMMMHEHIPAEIITAFKADIYKHVETGVPVQHLTGYEHFYGRKFKVNEHTLIPRPETEELVQHTIKFVSSYNIDQPLTIIDIGTGSGVIATTLALELPQVHVFATDISTEALKVAKENARQLEADVTFLQGDLLAPIVEHDIQAQIIVSNPPYIAKVDEASLSRTVKNFDPNLALFADENGLAAYKGILKLMPQALKSSGSFLFEIGYEQAESVSALIKNTFPTCELHVLQDINRKDRIITTSLS